MMKLHEICPFLCKFSSQGEMRYQNLPNAVHSGLQPDRTVFLNIKFGPIEDKKKCKSMRAPRYGMG